MKVYASIKNFLFLDIETVREYKDYQTLIKFRSPENWEKVAKRFMKEEGLTIEQTYEQKAALYVEYAKVVTVALGSFHADFSSTVGALYDDNEEVLLNKVAEYLNRFYAKYPDTILCGHNIKEFDIPFLIKRMIKYKIKIPMILQNHLSAKTWDQKTTDTLYDWRMAGNRFTGLDSIAEFLGFESSKQGEVKGSNLGEYYWNHPDPMEKKLYAIGVYCKADVRVLMDFAKRMYEVL